MYFLGTKDKIISKIPEKIQWYIPQNGRDKRDCYPCSIQDYYYFNNKGKKVIEYYKTFGFLSESQIDLNPNYQLCNQDNCIATINNKMSNEHLCNSCKHFVCYTCKRFFNKCNNNIHWVCYKCQNNCNNCKLIKNIDNLLPIFI